jgi:hypothetical protein
MGSLERSAKSFNWHAMSSTHNWILIIRLIDNSNKYDVPSNHTPKRLCRSPESNDKNPVMCT